MKSVRKMLVEKKQCSKCKKILLVTTEFFYKKKTGKGELRSQCKICIKKYSKQRNKDNPNYFKQWREKNPQHLKYIKQWKKTN